VESLADTNRGLNREIARRRTVERALQKSEQHQSRVLKQSRHMQAQLRRLSHQILQAQEEERKQISRELHDEIAQTLVGINVHLAALTRETPDNPRSFRQKIARTQRLVEKSVDSVHRFARELRPTMLDDLGLIPALHAYLKEFTKRTGIHVHFKTFTPGKTKQLNIATRTVFYRVAQEALTNVARHAQASIVEVSLEKLPLALCLNIKDNGKSFPVKRVLHPKRIKRLGLIGMRERLEMVGGTCRIVSAPGHGTTIRAQIPLANGAGAGAA
jgi:signal transduction histidine kinase